MASYKEKIKNAYLLFYDRVNPIKTEAKIREESKEKEERIDKKSNTNVEVEAKDEIALKQPNPLEEFHMELIENNFKFHIHKNIFSNEFFKFISNLIIDRDYQQNTDLMNYPFIYDIESNSQKYFDLELLKLGMIFLTTCIMREKERNSIVKFLSFMVENAKQVIIYLVICLNV